MDHQISIKLIPHILIEEPRISQGFALMNVFRVPLDGDLSSSIVIGKKALDDATNFSIVEPVPKVLEAPPAESLDNLYRISKTTAIPLQGPFSRRKIDGSHLWIDIENGRLVVLSDCQDEMMSNLCQGASPSSISDTYGLNSLIGLLAVAGFIRGIRGHVDKTIVDAKRFLRIHLTERCNLSCVHCYADSGPNVETNGELPPQRWIEILSEFAQLGGERVLFTGGEALAYSGCDQLLRHSKQLGLHVTLFTNGILVPKFKDAICESVDEVQVSIDGANPSSNDPIRGSGSFDKAVRAIDLLAELGVPVRVSTVAMKDNWDDIQRNYLTLVARWENLPVTFKINYGVMTHGRGEELKDELDINKTRPIIDSMMASIYPNDAARIVRSTSGCGYAEQIVVAPNGEIHPCHLLSGAIANLGQDTMGQVLNTLKKVQTEYSVDESVGCKSCDIRHLCGGTCRVENAKRTNNLRVTYCDAEEKLRKLVALKRTFT
ncbi:radical SAM/SPASM domain-containing protein [Pseudomonas sessilinigenes]|uniref:Radical SAM protein n=1 Tax=Pseudomonas sessilinigenes TaxID=658629 RepID=A0ABX8MVS0_9PSED|nr:radical SAM protein [Pseudomonas sessilinigenes]AZC24393.1 hypothetical protein C4K39_2719 [Pseudomonas sessilinigenes]QXH43334.1 radical SAM protein [Pseudomonas sessilinigenes]